MPHYYLQFKPIISRAEIRLNLVKSHQQPTCLDIFIATDNELNEGHPYQPITENEPIYSVLYQLGIHHIDTYWFMNKKHVPYHVILQALQDEPNITYSMVDDIDTSSNNIFNPISNTHKDLVWMRESLQCIASQLYPNGSCTASIDSQHEAIDENHHMHQAIEHELNQQLHNWYKQHENIKLYKNETLYMDQGWYDIVSTFLYAYWTMPIDARQAPIEPIRECAFIYELLHAKIKAHTEYTYVPWVCLTTEEQTRIYQRYQRGEEIATCRDYHTNPYRHVPNKQFTQTLQTIWSQLPK